jgi:hypothetical protein
MILALVYRDYPLISCQQDGTKLSGMVEADESYTDSKAKFNGKYGRLVKLTGVY